MAQGEVLKGELAVAAAEEGEESKQVEGAEWTERLTRLVPVDRRPARGVMPGTILLVAEARCATERPRVEDLRRGAGLRCSLMVTAEAFGGTARPIARVGILAEWPNDETGVDRAVRAASASLRAPRWGPLTAIVAQMWSAQPVSTRRGVVQPLKCARSRLCEPRRRRDSPRHV